jgi:hypothetical protein
LLLFAGTIILYGRTVNGLQSEAGSGTDASYDADVRATPAGVIQQNCRPITKLERKQQDATAMNPTSIHLHAYAGRENGLMVIGSAAALGELGQKLQAAASFKPVASAANWPSEVAVLDCESPYQDRPDYRVSFHVQHEPLPATLQRKSRQAPSTVALLVVLFLALVGILSLVRWVWGAL